MLFRSEAASSAAWATHNRCASCSGWPTIFALVWSLTFRRLPPIAADTAVGPVMEARIADGMDTSLPILR